MERRFTQPKKHKESNNLSADEDELYQSKKEDPFNSLWSYKSPLNSKRSMGSNHLQYSINRNSQRRDSGVTLYSDSQDNGGSPKGQDYMMTETMKSREPKIDMKLSTS